MTERLDALEQTVADLAREVRALRAVVDRLERERSGSLAAPLATPGLAAAGANLGDGASTSPGTAAGRQGPLGTAPPLRVPPAAPRDPDRRSGPGRRSIDFEAMVGRYGTLALASLTILLGVGAFLGWAIQQGKIGPGMRVFLGALVAAALAGVGWRLRMRGSTRFGSILLALALAVVHVDAWGAGPYLHLVPPAVALGIAAAAQWESRHSPGAATRRRSSA